MAKRRPDRDLNQDNWNQEDEVTDPGVFKPASEQTLAARPKLKARRSLATGDSSSDSNKPSPFAAFANSKLGTPGLFKFGGASVNASPLTASIGGANASNLSGGFVFGSPSASSAANPSVKLPEVSSPGSLFTFGANKGTTSSITSSSGTLNSISDKSFVFGGSPMEKSAAMSANKISEGQNAVSSDAGDKNVIQPQPGPKNSVQPQFEHKLKDLNEAFIKHVQHFMSISPYHDLSPCCRDYLEHYKGLEKQYESTSLVNNTDHKSPVNSASASSTTIAASNSIQSNSFGLGSNFSSTAPTAPFKFGAPENGSSNKPSIPTFGSFASQASPQQKPFSFGTPSTGATTPFGGSTGAPTVSLFGQSTTTSTTAPSFGANKGQSEEQNAGEGQAEEPTDEPPKPESYDHEEPNAVYTRRCKMYCKIDNGLKERGIGNLHIIKPSEDSKTKKYQLLMRADTKLGNILLNIALVPTLPTKLENSKHVTLACMINPPIDPNKPSEYGIVFFRVKDNAQELKDKLDHYKMLEG